MEGEGIEKIVKPCNIFDFHTRLEISLGLKLSGHNDTLTAGRKLIDEIYTRSEIQNEQQYRDAPNKFLTL